MSALCPPSYDSEALNRDEFAAFRAACCSASGQGGAGLCSSIAEWKCVERKCKQERLPGKLRAASNSSSSSRCESCSVETMSCNESSTTLQRLPVKEGYWRTNELSVSLLKCAPSVSSFR